jgi:hypothetical protein
MKKLIYLFVVYYSQVFISEVTICRPFWPQTSKAQYQQKTLEITKEDMLHIMYELKNVEHKNRANSLRC